MEIKTVNKEDWNALKDGLNWHSFGITPADENVDYALVGMEDGRVTGYATVVEKGNRTGHLKMGGAMDSFRGFKAWTGYRRMLLWLSERYDLLTTSIYNDNSPMLKLAIVNDWKIIGMEYNSGGLMLKFELRFRG